MFDIGWSEILVIAVVAILVVGPRDLPRMLRTIGQVVSKMRKMAGEFQTQFNDALKEADLDDIKKGIDSARSAIPTNPLRQGLESLTKAGSDVKAAIETPTVKPAAAVAAKTETTVATATVATADTSGSSAGTGSAKAQPKADTPEPAPAGPSKKPAKPKAASKKKKAASAT
jgi:sec-independent protein translocase protein TatB